MGTLENSDLSHLLCTMTPDLLMPSTKQLIKYLEDEEITSLVGLRDSLRTKEDIQMFVDASELRPEQVKLLYDAIEVCRNSASSLTAEVLRGARKRVVSYRALAVCDDNFETSQKFRRIESKAQRLTLGTVHTSVSSLVESKASVSLRAIQ